MTTLLSYIVDKSQRSQILAAGCAILFGYFVTPLPTQLNFATVSILELIGKIPRANRVRLYISRIIYIFGVAGISL